VAPVSAAGAVKRISPGTSAPPVITERIASSTVQSVLITSSTGTISM
jgi:hypothetical protein